MARISRKRQIERVDLGHLRWKKATTVTDNFPAQANKSKAHLLENCAFYKVWLQITISPLGSEQRSWCDVRSTARKSTRKSERFTVSVRNYHRGYKCIHEIQHTSENILKISIHTHTHSNTQARSHTYAHSLLWEKTIISVTNVVEPSSERRASNWNETLKKSYCWKVQQYKANITRLDSNAMAPTAEMSRKIPLSELFAFNFPMLEINQATVEIQTSTDSTFCRLV